VIQTRTRPHVHVLDECGRSHVGIADQLRISERAVPRILRDAPPTPADGGADPRGEAPKRGRPSKADDALVERVRQLLVDEPGLRATEVYRRAVAWGYAGKRSAMSELVRRLRPAPTPDLVVRFEGLPGEYGQFDFGEVVVTFADGRRERLHFFASRLKYSRLLHVELTPDQRAESVVRALVASFEAWGGAPREWVFDNPRTIRASLPGVVPVVAHPHLRGRLADIGGIPTFCVPAHGNQKGSVENLVGFVKGDFFLARRFSDHADVAAQLGEWLRETNHVRPCRATGEVPAARFERERPLLRSIPANVAVRRYVLREQRVVSSSALVHHEGTSYAVDPSAVGHTVDLLVGRDTVEVVDGGRVVGRHTRRRTGGVVRSAADRQATLAVLGGRQTGFFKRECLRELGPAAEDFLTRLVHAGPPDAWHGPVAELFDLLQQVGDARMRTALAATRQPTVAHVRRALGLEAA
jgi:transposase